MTNTTTTPATIDLSDQTAVVDAWMSAYAEPDVARRRAIIDQIWAADGELADPPFDGAGRDSLSDLADIVLTHYAGHTFRRTSKVDAHHEFARYGWELVAPDGGVAVAGTDFVTFAADGRLARTVGFFGPLEA
jgi:hypothetical protein